MFESIKPGQKIRCTVTRNISREDARQTVARLMRQDPEIRRLLKGAQERRRKHTPHKIRGGRVWMQRTHPARYALPVEGATWEMDYIPQLAPDFRSVEEFVKVEAA